MKKTLSITLMAFALMTIAGSAFGQAVIHITGSTAFRASSIAGIMDIFTPGTVYGAYDTGSTTYKGSEQIFYGELASLPGHHVYVKTFWTGSLAGVYDLSNRTIETKWIATPASPPPGGGVIPGTSAVMALCSHDTTGGTPNTGTAIHGLPYTTESIAPDAAFTDADQGSDATAISNATNGATFKATITNNALTDAGTVSPGTVGLVCFVWTAGHQAAALPYSNMTQEAAAALIHQGAVPYGQLAGNGDLANYAFIVSRNEDSGTRVDQNAESLAGAAPGAFAPSPVKTYLFTYSGSTTSYVDNNTTIQTGGAPAATVTGGGLWPGNWPLNTVPSCSWPGPGHSGYIAGGDVANNLKSTGDTVASFTSGKPAGFTNGVSHAALIGFLGAADQANSVGTRLTYCGVPYTVSNVQNGPYTLWDFEHLYIRSTAPVLAGDALQTCNDVADIITSTDAPTNGNGKTDNSGATPDVGGVLYDASCKFSKSGLEGSYLIPNGN
jgi:hypothetical protein